MPTTSNFGWTTPADTDLVKDGAAAIRTLGNGIDTSLVDLKGGTTGQVLSKASNTDLDYTWVTTDDANAIQNAIVDAKGDLIAASAADTPARLAVGNNGETLVADSSASTGLRWQGDYAAGKNAIINGDFRINQRGFSSTTTNGEYGFDRWTNGLTAGGGTVTFSAQTFTAGAAPVAGYEAINFYRCVTSGQANADSRAHFRQNIESVRTFANQTVTISFWAKAASGTPSLNVEILQVFGSGGSSQVSTPATKQTIGTSWARYSWTVAVPSISGKTVGSSGDMLRLNIWTSAGSDNATASGTLGIQNNTFDIWGVQVEAGNVATAFQTATGTLAGELAACQRYYVRFIGTNANDILSSLGWARTTTDAHILFTLPVEMRITPTAVETSTIELTDLVNEPAVGTVTLSGGSTSFSGQLNCATTGLTQFRPYVIRNDNNAAGYVAFTAEL